MSKSEQSPPAPSPLSPQDLETLAALVAERLNKDALSEFLDERAAAKLVGLTHRSLQAMRYDGTGPDFIKFGDHPRSPVRYSRADLIRWANTRRRYRSTAQNGGVAE
jgi:hypothetical protein